MMRNVIIVVTALLVVASTSVDAADTGDVIYSVLFPGWGQIRAGRYGRGALLVSAEIITLTGLMMADIQYDRAVEQYDRARAFYLNARYIGDAHYYFDTMNEKWDDAENLHTYRTILLGTAIGVWAAGVADMMWGGGGDGPPLSLDVSNGGFIVSKTFSF
ncbi:MAG TPA: hypothetical protein VMX58_05285 [Patescibacteria group bacterium]|nr:hypothetical protein [Patescibacteria group bacterium]